jgi:hypothetical protein
MVFLNLEDYILPESPIRFIDAFVEAILLQTLGFILQTIKMEWRRALKLQSF